MEDIKIYNNDCFNVFPEIPEKSIDMILVDLPYNQTKCAWDCAIDLDKMWIELKRICSLVIIHGGYGNLNMWIADIEKPLGIAYIYIKNNQSRSSIAFLEKLEPLFIYGKMKKRLKTNVFPSYSKWGFLAEGIYIHPCPMNNDFVHLFINELNPQSVIDPFLGSGTTAEVCTKLGIPWIGYEIMEEYSVDINKRLKNCKKEPSQVELVKYL